MVCRRLHYKLYIFTIRSIIASGSADCSVRVWDLSKEKCVLVIPHPDKVGELLYIIAFNTILILISTYVCVVNWVMESWHKLWYLWITCKLYSSCMHVTWPPKHACCQSVMLHGNWDATFMWCEFQHAHSCEVEKVDMVWRRHGHGHRHEQFQNKYFSYLTLFLQQHNHFQTLASIWVKCLSIYKRRCEGPDILSVLECYRP